MDSATPESTAPSHSGWAATMFVCKTTRVTTSGYDPTSARRLVNHFPEEDDSRYRKAVRSIFVNGLPALLSGADSGIRNKRISSPASIAKAYRLKFQ
jgi:hypothetical protein